MESSVSALKAKYPKRQHGIELITKALPSATFQHLTPIQQDRLTGYAEYVSNSASQMVPPLCWSTNTPALTSFSFNAVRGLALSEKEEPEFLEANQDTTAWVRTATNGSINSSGTGITLTWSIVPDGTDITSGITDDFDNTVVTSSNLIAKFNEAFGSSQTGHIKDAPWFSFFADAFAEWGENTGNTFIYEPNDDGADLPVRSTFFGTRSNSGITNTRGDIRISGATIDGNGGILAFNFIPDLGDMVIDTGDSFNIENTTTGRRRLFNVITHELGHAIGLDHVCPVNQTKLMEPFISTAYEGVQFDDILTAQNLYGDPLEVIGEALTNDTTASASPIGTIEHSRVLDTLSISRDGDKDLIKFDVDAPSKVTVNLTPTQQSSYSESLTNADGSCSTGTTFNPQALQNLSLRLLAADGVTPLANSISGGIAEAEQISDLILSPDTDYFIEISGDGANSSEVNNTQIYQLELLQTTYPTLNLIADDSEADEFDLSNTALLSVNANASADNDITIPYTLSGSATAGLDFVALTGSTTLSSGLSSSNIAISALRDALSEGVESVTITLTPSNDYALHAASATISIKDLPADQWKFENFGGTGSSSGDSEDFDSDGIPNLIEYAFSTDPTSASSSIQSSLTKDGDTLVLQYTEDLNLPDITYTVESSPDLSEDSWSTEGIRKTQGATIDGKREVSASISIDSEKQFIRLSISRTTP